MLRCAILDDYQDAAKQFGDWSQLGDEVAITTFQRHLGDPDQLAEALSDFQVIVAMRERTRFDRGLLERLDRLSLLVTTGLKNAAIDVSAANDLGITVCGTLGDHNSTVELTWALILSAARNIVAENNSVRRGGWQVSVGRSLRGRRLGVVGLGNIGRKVARIGIAFGMEVSAWSPNITEARCDEIGAAMAHSLHDLTANSDILTIHLALSETTSQIITADHLRRLPRHALLINTARAYLIEEQALMKALHNRWFAGAALDVFHDEPLPLDHPLRRMEHVLITPHIGYVADKGYRLYFEGAIEAIRAWRAGAPLNVIGKNIAPRASGGTNKRHPT